MPENNIIAKKLSLNLDTKKQTIVKVNAKDFTAVIGDSIEITVNLTEDNTPKNLTGVKVCRLIGIRPDESYFEQTEGITVVDELNGIIKIYPRLDIYSTEGQTISGLILEDEDEIINIQRFTINVVKSIATDIVVEVKDDIETLKKLNDLLNKYQLDLVNINQSIVDMETKVDEKLIEVDGKFNELSNNIGSEINDLQNKVDGLDHTINYELTKAIKLKPYRLAGSNYIYMETDIFNIPANDLLKRAYRIFIGGILDNGTYNTAIGELTFFKQNNKISPFYLSISDRSINNKTLNPSVVFGDLSNEMSPTAMGFKLMVKSNILKTMNLDSDTVCYMTPFGVQ